MAFKIRLQIAALFLLIAANVSATTVSGRLTSKSGEALSFASVYIKGTTNGTTTNIDGYYSLNLAPGKYELAFRYVGFQLKITEIEVGTTALTINAKLEDESVSLKEVSIRADAEDPAYAVIRQAQKKRKYYLEEVKAYSCDVYIKGEERIKKYPKKILGQELDAKSLGILDTTSGIVYLSESVSKFNFKNPDKIKEEMISSKVSGNNKSFSYNQASDMLFNLYENLIQIDQLSERGFVSPISGSAMLYYKYHLDGVFRENGLLINKIKVSPIRKNDPVFRGTIYIVEDSWRIHSAELMLTKDANIDFVDTLTLFQSHTPVDKDVWLPISNRFEFIFKFLGIKGDGMFVGVNSNYVINPDFPKNFFTNEVLKVTDEANKKDSTYWTTNRPVPLTTAEVKDYKVRDSLQKFHESKAYLDSVDHKRNKLKPLDILFGYTYDNSFKKESFTVTAPIEDFQYNTVQGFNIGVGLRYRKRFENFKSYSIEPVVRYGFSNKQFNGKLRANYYYKPQRFANVSIEGGSDVVQFNSANPISPLINTFYTLLDKNNFMKIYKKDFLKLGHVFEVVNGVVLNTTLEYADRSPLENTTDYTWLKRDKDFTPNTPRPDVPILHDQALTLNVGLRLRFKQKYYTRPNQKIISGSKYPTLTINYRKGVHGLIGSDVDYDFIKIGIEDDMKFGLLGTSSYKVSVGKFLRSNNLAFADYNHFSGNQTLFTDDRLERFSVMPYYTYSTAGPYLEAHYEHHFGGFILNKFPLIRKLRFTEIASAHFLTSDKVNYFEFSVGVQRGIIPIRVEFVSGFADKQKTAAGIRICLPF